MTSKPKGKRRGTGDTGNAVCWGVCENEERQGHTLCSLTQNTVKGETRWVLLRHTLCARPFAWCWIQKCRNPLFCLPSDAEGMGVDKPRQCDTEGHSILNPRAEDWEAGHANLLEKWREIDLGRESLPLEG